MSGAGERRKLVISFDDLDDGTPPIAPPASAPVAPEAFPTVEGVRRAPLPVPPGPVAPAYRAPAAGGGLHVANPHVRNVVAAAVGVVPGWALTEILSLGDGWGASTKLGADFQAGLWVGLVGFFF